MAGPVREFEGITDVDRRHFDFVQTLLRISEDLTVRETEHVKLYCMHLIPNGRLEQLDQAVDVFKKLIQLGKIDQENLDFIKEILKRIGRQDLIRDVLGPFQPPDREIPENPELQPGTSQEDASEEGAATANTYVVVNGPQRMTQEALDQLRNNLASLCRTRRSHVMFRGVKKHKSILVHFTIPREDTAVLRLMANHSDPRLVYMGVKSLQIDGEQPVNVNQGAQLYDIKRQLPVDDIKVGCSAGNKQQMAPKTWSSLSALNLFSDALPLHLQIAESLEYQGFSYSLVQALVQKDQLREHQMRQAIRNLRNAEVDSDTLMTMRSKLIIAENRLKEALETITVLEKELQQARYYAEKAGKQAASHVAGDIDEKPPGGWSTQAEKADKRNEEEEKQQKNNDDSATSDKDRSRAREALQRIFPEINMDATLEYQVWLTSFEKAAIARLGYLKTAAKQTQEDESAESKLAEAAEREKELQEECEKYKTVLADTESILNRLQSTVESEEQKWEGKLRLANEDLEQARREAAEREKELQEECEKYKTVLADTESILNRLQSTVESEEQKWEGKLRLANKDLEQARREAAEREKELQEECEKYKTVLADTESILKRLQSTVESEEQKWEGKLRLANEDLEQARGEVRAMQEVVQQVEFESLKGPTEEDLSKRDDEIAALKARLEKEKKLCKELGSAATKLQSLLKTAEDQLKKERENVKKLQGNSEERGSTENAGSSQAKVGPADHTKEDLSKRDEEIAALKARLEKEKKLCKELGSAATKLQSLLKTAEDQLRKEREHDAAISDIEKDRSWAKEALQRIFPDISMDATLEYQVWLTSFEKAAIARLEDLKTKQTAEVSSQTPENEGVESKLAEAAEREKQLQEECEKYKTVLADTESILNKLNKASESEERKWQEKLRLANEHLEQVKREAAEREKELQRECEKYKTVLADTESILYRLNRAAGSEEQKWQEKLRLASKDLEQARGEVRAMQEVVQQVEFESLKGPTEEDLSKRDEEIAALKARLEKEKKLCKELGSAATKLQSLLKTAEDQLKKERENVKKLQENSPYDRT
ncbi:kinectin-like [Branchiostoma lanceolatum]|uniref:kinectin-like n=1 Tax=Branchiostoma lanceolatum TaxID=7740 RepID=UPI003454434E